MQDLVVLSTTTDSVNGLLSSSLCVRTAFGPPRSEGPKDRCPLSGRWATTLVVRHGREAAGPVILGHMPTSLPRPDLGGPGTKVRKGSRLCENTVP